jgi:hypothetical protein
MMKSVGGKILAIYGLALLLGSVACENIALIKRPTPQLDGDEIVGEITRIDSGLKLIYLRPTADVSGRASTQTVRYDDNTQVLSRGREYPVSSLEVGDIVALPVWQRDRDRSANLIRVQQSRRDRERRGPEARLKESKEQWNGSIRAVSLNCANGLAQRSSCCSRQMRRNRLSLKWSNCAGAITF